MGRTEALATGIAQLGSAVVFGLIATQQTRALMWLFISEAIGQVGLGVTSLRSDHVRYFSGPLGVPTLLVFSGVILARASLGPTVIALSVIPLLAAIAFVRWRDRLAGLAIMLSAIGLGVAWVVDGRPFAAATQFAYVLVLVVGVGWLRPSVAELINVPVFATAALVGERLSGQ